MKWHNPGLGEVHNEDHSQMIYCEDADGIVDDVLAERICNLLNSESTPKVQPDASFADPRVQTVYNILCSDNLPPSDENWEVFAARLIVDALAQSAQEKEGHR